MTFSSGVLQGLGVLERDVNDEVVSWWFPAFDTALDATVRARAGLIDTQQGGGGGGSAPTTPPLTPSNSSLASFTSFFPTSPSSPPPSFRYSRASTPGVWHYSLTLPVESSSVAVLSHVRVAAVVLLASSYDVTKARALLHSLAKVHRCAAAAALPLPIFAARSGVAHGRCALRRSCTSSPATR